MKRKHKSFLQKALTLILCALFLFPCFSVNTSALSFYTPEPSVFDLFNGADCGFIKVKIKKIHEELYYSYKSRAEEAYNLDEDAVNELDPHLIVEFTIEEAFYPNCEFENEIILAVPLQYIETKHENGEYVNINHYFSKTEATDYLNSCDIVYLYTKAIYPLSTRPEKYYTATNYFEPTDFYITKEVVIVGSLDLRDFTRLYFIPMRDDALQVYETTAMYGHGNDTFDVFEYYDGIEEYFSDGLTESETDESIKRLYSDTLEYEKQEAERKAQIEAAFEEYDKSFLEVIFEFFIEICRKIFEFFKKIFQKFIV